MPEKIIVMGGSFNPPTIAHRALLLAAVDALQAQTGLFVPSSDAYVRKKMKKQGCAREVLSEELRARMLYAMCRTDQRLAVEECEFQDDGKGHTFDTMEKIQKIHPGSRLYFLIGDDKLQVISRWHRREEFFQKFRFAVVRREGTSPLEQILANPCLKDSRDIFFILPEPEGIGSISSSALRRKLRRGDESARQMTDEEVWKLLLEAGWMRRPKTEESR